MIVCMLIQIRPAEKHTEWNTLKSIFEIPINIMKNQLIIACIKNISIVNICISNKTYSIAKIDMSLQSKPTT